KSAGYRCRKSEISGTDPNPALCNRQRSYRVPTHCGREVLLVPAINGIVIERLDTTSQTAPGYKALLSITPRTIGDLFETGGSQSMPGSLSGWRSAALLCLS